MSDEFERRLTAWIMESGVNDPLPQALLDEWPNCMTPDCEHKQCMWAKVPFCFVCAAKKLGRAELIRRFNETHEVPWGKHPEDPAS